MSPTLDVNRLRRDTPGCEERVHLANAGASLVPGQVAAAVQEHLTAESRLGGYDAMQSRRTVFDRYRRALARLVNADSDRIAFSPSGTAGWHTILGRLDLDRGGRVLVSMSEYSATVLPLLQLARRAGLSVECVPDGPAGSLDVAALVDRLDHDVRAVVVCQAASHVGVVNDVAAVGSAVATQAPHTRYIVDACQSVGQLPVNVRDLRCDALIATGRKWLRGPRGSGFLFFGPALDDVEPYPLDANSGRWVSEESYELATGIGRFEPWEQSWAAQSGLGAAVEYLLRLGPDAVYQRIARSAARIRAGLRTIPGVTVPDRGATPGGIVSFFHHRVSAPEIRNAVGQAGINVGVVLPESGRFDFTAQGYPDMVRVSAHAYNTDAEIDRLLDVVSRAVA